MTKGTILAVDDEPDILIALEDLFEDDYRVLTTTKPAEALSILRAEPDIAVILGIVLSVFELRPDPMMVPEPRLIFTFDKTYLSPARLIHFLGVLLAFQSVYGLVAPRLGLAVAFLTGLGRNSLAVFSMGSILSLAGQLFRFWTGGGFLVDVLVLSVGLFALGSTAWFVEWRSRKPRLPA